MGGICCCCCKPKSTTPQDTSKNTVSEQPIARGTRPYSPRKGYTDIGITKNDPLLLIRGFEKEPLVPLEEALQPFNNEIDQLSYYIRDAKAKCKNPSEHGLTKDESAAIYIYTNHWSNQCLYNHLDRAWKSKDPAQMRRWFKFLRLFKSGYDKLPKAPRTVWQGGPYNEPFNNHLRSNVDSLYSAMCLCSMSKTDVMEYLKKHGNAKMMLIAYAAEIGRLAVGYTANSSDTVLLWPGMKLAASNAEVFDSLGSTVWHFSKKTDPVKLETKIVKSKQKHFVCQNSHCGYRCRGNHTEGHCSGFDHIHHECQHHCGPKRECYSCDTDKVHYLRQCKRCENYFCDNCCLKENF